MRLEEEGYFSANLRLSEVCQTKLCTDLAMQVTVSDAMAVIQVFLLVFGPESIRV